MHKKALLVILALIIISSHYACEALYEVFDVPQEKSTTDVLPSEGKIESEHLPVKEEKIKETETVPIAPAEDTIALTETTPDEIQTMKAMEPEIVEPEKPVVDGGPEEVLIPAAKESSNEQQLAKARTRKGEATAIEQSASEAVQDAEALLSEKEIVKVDPVEPVADTVDRETLLLAPAPAETMEEPVALPSSGSAEVQAEAADEVHQIIDPTIEKDTEEIVKVEPMEPEADTAGRETLLLAPIPAETMEEPVALPSSGAAAVQAEAAGEVHQIIDPTIEKDAEEIEAVVQEVIAYEEEDDQKAADQEPVEKGPEGFDTIAGDEKEGAAAVEKQKSFSDFKVRTEFFKKTTIEPVTEFPIDTSVDRLAVLPFDNFTETDDAVNYVMPVLKQYLAQRGMKAIEEERFMKFLCSEGVRFGGFVSADLAEKARDELKVQYIMAGAIVLFSTGDNPKVGILARLIDSTTGIIVWSDYASITGEDFIKLLGMGKVRSIDSLIPKAMDRLFASFTTDSPAQGVESTYTVAVMPILNESEYSYAGKIATYMFLTELFHSKAFTPVEFGEIRKFVVDQRIKTRGGLGYRDMDALMARLNTGSVLVGTIEHYPTKKERNNPPRVVISARLIDAANKKILWYNSKELDGEDDIIAFDWGRLRTADRVAYKTITGLVKNMESVE